MSKDVVKVNKNVEKLKNVLSANSVREQFENSLKENSGAFIASIIDLYGSDSSLQQCDPNAVVMECLKAATLKLPINKQLGFAYVVPYKGTPQFQLGYKGYIQLAMRTGQYRYLNAGIVYEGMEVERDILTGKTTIIGEATSDKAQGYFAYMELLNGFSKTLYMTVEEVEGHAKRYSPSYNYKTSAWKTNFDEMATKTVIRNLLSKYGIMSTDMIVAFTSDIEDTEANIRNEIAANANVETIDVDYKVVDGTKDESKQDVVEQVTMEGPGF